MSETGSVPDGWEGLLAEGEEILWQGRPDDKVLWSDLVHLHTAFGLFFTLFSLFWMAMAWKMGNVTPGGGVFSGLSLFPLFGLPFLAIGLYTLIGRIFFDSVRRRGTFYTLTSRAAYVATQIKGKRELKRYSLLDDVRPRLEDGDPGSVFFSTVTTVYHGRKRGMVSNVSTPIGFRRIPEARKVYLMMSEAVDRARGYAPEGD